MNASGILRLESGWAIDLQISELKSRLSGKNKIKQVIFLKKMPVPEKKKRSSTYADYLTWPDEERWEIIDGEVYDMTPAPSVRHQRVVWNVIREISNYLEGQKQCQGFSAPTDVVFDEYNVVQPDVFVVCDNTKVGEKAIFGVPDLVVEVISPATEVKDRREKKNLYERFGVAEYILVFPERNYVERYLLQEGKYGAPEIVNWDETIRVVTFDMEIHLWEIFEKEKPSEEQ